jgi:hypothetical protein
MPIKKQDSWLCGRQIDLYQLKDHAFGCSVERGSIVGAVPQSATAL